MPVNPITIAKMHPVDRAESLIKRIQKRIYSWYMEWQNETTMTTKKEEKNYNISIFLRINKFIDFRNLCWNREQHLFEQKKSLEKIHIFF